MRGRRRVASAMPWSPTATAFQELSRSSSFEIDRVAFHLVESSRPITARNSATFARCGFGSSE